MKNEFVLRGQTASGETELLEFGGYKEGYAYRLTEFTIYPSTNIAGNNIELVASVTAAKIAVAPTDPNFNDEGLIGTALFNLNSIASYPGFTNSVINDTFLITQNLILMVQDQDGGDPINWQCRFESVKMTGPEEAAVNFKQFSISDE